MTSFHLATSRRSPSHRRGAIIVLSAFLMVVIFALTAFAIDVGYMLLVRTQLQAAADAGAMAAGNSMHLDSPGIVAVGKQYVTYHHAGGRLIDPSEAIVEPGTWNAATGQFTASAEVGNAVRVTARRSNESFFFAKLLGESAFNMEASAVAMANPRDIAFVVDLSGSMNDDTEPAWATSTINGEFASSGFPTIGSQLMQDLYNDLGFGTFPGTLEYVGAPLGVAADEYAYAEMTKDGGPLADASMPAQYRIYPGDDEATRKLRAYSWIIDNQIARLMPAASPAPTLSNYAYWEKYLDYLMHSVWVHSPLPPDPDDGDDDGGGGSTEPPPPTPPIGLHRLPGVELLALSPTARPHLMAINMLAMFAQPGTPPVDRGWLPYWQDGDRIHNFNNPNYQTFPSADGGLPYAYRNYIGYQTYTQFLMDHGRDLKPEDATFAMHSTQSAACPYHQESTAGGSFSFPPREQPMHACRRSLIAAMAVVEDRNQSVPDVGLRDHVSVITFDTLADGNTPQIAQSLTGDYQQAMEACTELQAVGDKGTTTATEAGLALAAEHLKPPHHHHHHRHGGSVRQGRKVADKVVVLLTDGVPNDYQSSNATIDSYMASNSSGEYYGGGYYWLDAALMQSQQMEAAGTDMYPVGIGLGSDYDFMDRMARLGGTAGDNGTSPRGSGNPAEYESALTDIFENIIKSPTARLVQ